MPSTGIPINGKYLLPTIPDGVDFEITSASHVLPIDGTDVSSQGLAHLLAAYSMFENLWFDPLFDATGIDLAGQFIDSFGPFAPPADPAYYYPRCQVGALPTHTAILPINTQILAPEPPAPGLLLTNTIDISAETGWVGTDEFMVYWRLLDFTVSNDVATDTINTPAIRTVIIPDQEPAGLEVYLSPDDGVHWCRVGLMEPIAFWNKTTSFKLALLNRGTTKIYVGCLAVLF